jgi:hypothetical protein
MKYAVPPRVGDGSNVQVLLFRWNEYEKSSACLPFDQFQTTPSNYNPPPANRRSCCVASFLLAQAVPRIPAFRRYEEEEASQIS